jgi:hypothetical protein
MTAAYGQSEFHALDKLSLQDTEIASSRLDDGELDRVEGGLEVSTASSSLVDLTSEALMQAAALENAAQAAGGGSVIENRVDRTTMLTQVCGSQPCTQRSNMTTVSRI